MKVLLLAFLFISTNVFSQDNSIPLQFRLSWLEKRIHVDMLFYPTDKDSSVFSYGNLDYGGQKDILKGVQNVKVLSPAKLQIDTAKWTYTFIHPTSEALHISYDIADTRSETTTRSQLFRPLIMGDYFFIHGFNLFLLPVNKEKAATTRVSIQWDKMPPFPLFYTFKPESDGKEVCVSTVDSITFRFLTGATDLKVKKFISESGKNYLVIRNGGMSAEIEKQIEDFYLSYNRNMRKFWKDKRIIEYSLVLQPYLNVNHDISGVSFGNGFIGKYNRPDSLVKGTRLFVLSHEIGHYYLSDVAAFEGEDNIGQWFNEGFNDYVTYFNLLNAGMMNSAEFENDMNKVFKDLYSSPIRNTPNNKIFENFWRLGDYSKLPYWRGCVFAFYLDNQISLASKNKYSIRDLLLDIKSQVHANGKKEFSSEEFIGFVAKYIPKEKIEKLFQEYIEEGASIPFSKDSVLPFFTINEENGIPHIAIIDAKKFNQHFRFK